MPANVDYSNLKKEIMGIYEFSKKDMEKGNNRVAIELNFEIGKRISGIEEREDLKYGQRIVERLSKDLNAKYGKGFSSRNLRHARKFYGYYKNEKIEYGLSWTHYRLLLSVTDKNERKSFEKRALDGGWSHRELQEKLISERGKKPFKIGVLKRPVGEFHLFRIVKNFSLKSERSVHFLDLGLNVFAEYLFSNHGEKFSVGSIVKSVKKGKEFVLEKTENTIEGNLFLYEGFLERIVDGDTLLFRIDLGFGVFTRQRLRLRGINSPEMETKEGKKIFSILQKKLNGVTRFVIKTTSKDKYGRYLADVLYLSGQGGDVLKEGLFLNQELLEEGFSRIE